MSKCKSLDKETLLRKCKEKYSWQRDDMCGLGEYMMVMYGLSIICDHGLFYLEPWDTGTDALRRTYEERVGCAVGEERQESKEDPWTDRPSMASKDNQDVSVGRDGIHSVCPKEGI